MSTTTVEFIKPGTTVYYIKNNVSIKKGTVETVDVKSHDNVIHIEYYINEDNGYNNYITRKQKTVATSKKELIDKLDG